MDNDARIDVISRTLGKVSPAELVAFLTVAETGGFRAAARLLALSPSALSHAVATLEARFDVQLFHRTKRNVSLTEAGQSFHTRIAPAFDEINRAAEALGEHSVKPAGRLRINSCISVAEHTLLPFVSDFLKMFPDISLEVVCDGRLVDIAAEGFDCGIRPMELVSSEMVAIPIGPIQRNIVVGAPNYLDSAPALLSPADLARHRCIQLRMASGVLFRWEFERNGNVITVATSGNLILDSGSLTLAAALQGMGLTYITRWAAAPFLADGRLVHLLEPWTPAYPGLSIYYPKHRHLSAAMRAFIAFARQRVFAERKGSIG